MKTAMTELVEYMKNTLPNMMWEERANELLEKEKKQIIDAVESKFYLKRCSGEEYYNKNFKG
jgi:hypothetical protein